MLKIVLLFIFTNLIQIKEKMHVPVTFHFPDYFLNENMHNVFVSRMGCFPDTPFFMTDARIHEHISFES